MRTRLRSRRAYLSMVVLSGVMLAACSAGSAATKSADTSSSYAAPTAGPAVGCRRQASRGRQTRRACQRLRDLVPRPAGWRSAPAGAEPPIRRSRCCTGCQWGAAPAAAAKPAAAAPRQHQATTSPRRRAIAAPAPTPINPGNPTNPADPAPVIPAQAGRMVIYVTDIAILTTNPSQLVNSLGDIATQAGGYVAGVENKDDAGVPVTSIKVKLPPDRYDAAMRQIRALAVEVTSEKATTQDVTEEFSDVQTQLASLEATYAQLLELLKKATTIDEILKINEKVAQTKAQIDRLKGRETFLQRNSELATITVNAKPAEEVLARNFSALRSSVRRSEALRAQTVKAIQAAKTPEEEATLRDRLGEVTLELDRLNARLADVQAKAQAASITLPSAPADEPVADASSDQELIKQYLSTVGQRRAAELERDRLTAEQRQHRPLRVSGS